MNPKYSLENVEDDKEELEFLRESLNEMDELSEQTARVLKVFDLRLKNLAKISAPIYKSTEKVARLYVNVGETVNSLDNILKFYEASGHDSAIIISGIQGDDIDLYLSSIKHLHEAESALSKIKLLSASQSQKETEKLIAVGHRNVEKYLSSKAKKGSKKVDPTSYSLVIESLSDLVNSSMDSFNISNNDNPSNKSNITSNPNPASNFLIMKSSPQSQPISTGSSIFRIYSENFIKLLVCERQLIDKTMPDTISRESFNELAEKVYNSYIRSAQRVCEHLTDSIYSNITGSIEFRSVIKDTYNSLDKLLNLEAAGKNEMKVLINSISTPLYKTFTGLIQTLKSTTNKPHVSKSGGIYGPTVMAFELIKNIAECKGKVEEIMYSLGDGHWNERSDSSNLSGQRKPSGLQILSHYIEDYISAISQMIEVVSKQYNQPGSMFAFQANNYHYISNAIKYSTVISSLLPENVVTKYENLTLRNRKALQAIWQSCLSTFMSSNINSNEKIELFNNSFEKICNDLSNFVVYDPDLRGYLIQDAVDSLVPKYSAFLDENKVNRNYLKFPVSAVEKRIDQTYSNKRV
ncbi:Exocyst complex protein exo70 [Smittium mucronatum]|uniref:Exocyst complex protein EXO70 n=1 Tax=Smittium mucronatum TaxID=133383 RepID=A0A1R0GT88_9FUNG|nr:Exocyst complex protein exo70 [Smittium mucronatum]OLY80637.1 Exocyst complex protein exo70 [Smittium mucronatum]